MADSLREAAEAELQGVCMTLADELWRGGIITRGDEATALHIESRIRPLIAALSAPDPVAEAITLINRLNRGCYCGYDHRCGNCQAILDVQEWAERNG